MSQQAYWSSTQRRASGVSGRQPGTPTSGHRRDFPEERLLGMCDVEAVDEPVARRAAHLRTGAGSSAVHAIVVACAEGMGGVVLTQNPKDQGKREAYYVRKESNVSRATIRLRYWV